MIRVLFFAAARETAGRAELELACGEDGLSSGDFWAALIAECPRLADLRRTTRLARNHEYLTEGERLQAGDEVALIPPVSGG